MDARQRRARARAWLSFFDPARAAQGTTDTWSLDGGATWLPGGRLPEDTCHAGNAALAPDGTLYKFGCSESPRGVGVGVSRDGRLSWTWHVVAPRQGDPDAWLGPLVMGAVDEAGAAYAVWSEPRADASGTNIMLSGSTDHGATWSTPTRVNGADGAFVLATVTAGAPGSVALAAYGTRERAVAGKANGDWYVLVFASGDASALQPAWDEGVASDAPAASGPVCILQTCINGWVTDAFGLQADAQGKLHVAFVDATGSRLRALIADQTQGPSLGRASVEKTGGS